MKTIRATDTDRPIPNHCSKSAYALCAAALVVPSLLYGQDFSLKWSTTAGGGSLSSAGTFTLQSTIGQPGAAAMSSGEFDFSGGFWSIVGVANNFEAPVLSLLVSGSQVALSWPTNAGPGFVLEEAATLTSAPGSSAWTPLSLTPAVVNDMYVVSLAVASDNRFYRLRQ